MDPIGEKRGQHNPHTTWGPLMKRVQRVAANRGTIFRYGPEFRYTLENNGMGFRNFDFSG
jgi:hypothetical protein